MIWLVM